MREAPLRAGGQGCARDLLLGGVTQGLQGAKESLRSGRPARTFPTPRPPSSPPASGQGPRRHRGPPGLSLPPSVLGGPVGVNGPHSLCPPLRVAGWKVAPERPSGSPSTVLVLTCPLSGAVSPPSPAGPLSPSSSQDIHVFNFVRTSHTLPRSDSGIVAEQMSANTWPQVCGREKQGSLGDGNGGVLVALHPGNCGHHPGSPLE